MVGQNIGKYRVLDRVGRGGMGTVYRALDETLHRDVAIKVLNAELNDPEVARRFRAEAITVARLSHPGIATIYELFQHDGQWLMVMEFVQGETLERVIERDGALAPERAAELCMQSLAALAHAHSMGIVHRDLKPANIMLTEGGAIKIMDFGIARVAGTEHLTNAGFMMGTPAYMAPEQVLGQEIDARADVYAMGVVFYRLLSAHLPFKGDTPFSMAHAQVNNLPTPIGTYRQGLPPWVDEIMARSLAKKPDDRFQSAVDFHEGFARSLVGQPMTSVYNSSAPTGLMMTPPRAVPTGTVERAVSFTPPSTPRAGQTVADLTIAPAAGVSAMDVGPTMAVATPPLLARPATAEMAQTELTPVIQARPSQSQAANPPRAAGPAINGPAAKSPAPVPTGAKGRGGLIAIAASLLVLLGLIAFFVWPRGGQPAVPLEPAAVGITNAAAAAPPVTPDPAPVAPAPPVIRPVAPPAAAAVGPDGPAVADGAARGEAGAPAPGEPTAAGRGAGGAARRAVPVIAVDQVFDDVKVMLVDGRKANDEDVRLNFVPAQLTIVGERAGNAIANLPYRDVANMTYSRGRDPKWNAAFSSPPDNLDVGGILRTPKHWLILQTNDSFLLFRLEDSNWTRVIEAVETRTGLVVNRPTSNDQN